ncbi:vertnin [Elysia marginata]|uniref:Vertnin n=1 Tax=Elysia marginata TaxID=1093978 RepID=A0AAV4IZI1_9GAST|nr:vertnin [Elysia marginata]
MQSKNVCQNNDEDIPVTRSEGQIADDAFETVSEPECVVGDSERMSEPGCGVDDSETVGEPECVVADSERMSEPGCSVDDSETVGEPECVVGDSESEKMSEPECSVGNCERMDGPECASNYDAVKYITCLGNLRVTESLDDFIQECQSQMSEMREVCGRGRSVLESRITIENWAIASVLSDIPGQSHQQFPVKVRCDGDCLPACGAVFAFGQDVRPEEMRLRIVHELAVNAFYYLDNNYLSHNFTGKKNCLQSIASLSDHYFPEVHDLSKITVLKALYEKELKDICKPRSYMGMWQMFGLASVLQMRICSVYPEVSTYSELRTQLHRVIEPRDKKTDDVATILWTSTRMSTKSLSWVPNHFVPLLAFIKT